MKTVPILRSLSALFILFFTLSGSMAQPITVFAQGSSAGIVVSPTTGLTTSESGQQARFTVVLTAAPNAGEQVNITLESDQPGEGLPAPTQLSFDETNWDQARTVTVTGQDDLIADGDITYHVVTLPAESNDPASAYNGLNPDDVSLTNLDNDSAGISITPVSGLTTSESGQTDSFTVRLDSRPLNNVSISLSSSDTSEGRVSPAAMTFTPTNWQTAQTATLTGQDDLLFDGTQNYTIAITASSNDPAYELTLPGIAAQNLDNEQVTISTQPDSYTIDQDQVLSQTAPGVLNNDSTNNGSLTAELDSSVANGSLTLNPNGSFVYTPNPGFNGTDSFSYRARNGTLSSASTNVSLTVNKLAAVIVTAQPDSYPLNQGETLSQSAPGVLANDTTSIGALSAEVVTSVAHGSLMLNANGSFIYTPDSGYSGPDSFTYRARSGSTFSDPATVSLDIRITLQISTQPDTYTLNQGQTITQAAPGVLANDTTNNTVALTAELVTNVFHGSLTLNANGSFIYTPTPGYSGPDSFTYIAHSGPITSSSTLVSLTVVLVNQPPTAVDDSYLTNSNGRLDVPAPGVLANDIDPEMLPLKASLISGPDQGNAKLNSNGSFTYTPPTGFSGLTSFTYQITDPGGKTATATVTIQVEVDTTAPLPVTWVKPGIESSVHHYSSGSILLEVTVDPAVTDLARVIFYRWDAPTQRRIELGSDSTSRYTLSINTSSLNYDWNQIDAAAMDNAGNLSALRHIWLIRDLPPLAIDIHPVAYIPLIRH